MEWPSRPPPPPRTHGYGHEHELYHPMILPPRRDFQNPVEPVPYSGMQSYAPERHTEPLPFGTVRRRTESRRVEEPGRSKQKISHRHGSGHQKQSAFTGVHNEATPGHYYADDSPKKFHYHYPNETPYRFSRRHDRLDGQEKNWGLLVPEGQNIDEMLIQEGRMAPHYDPRLVRDTFYHPPDSIDPKRRTYSEAQNSVSTISYTDRSYKDKLSPTGLSFGFSFGVFAQDQRSSISLPETSLTNLDRAGVKGSNNIVRGDSKVYRESIFNVSSSRYTNRSDLGLPCEAELVLQPLAGASERSLHPLLNWIHLEGKNHTFDSFVAYVANMNGLGDVEKYKARNLLKDVKRYEKPLQTSQGIRGSYVEAVCSSIEPEDGKQDEPGMIFLCLPYFVLASLSKQSPSQRPETHQLRTLLQYSRGHTSRSRDLQQAVCHLDHSPKGQCFHVSYLWCLVIGNDILITCTNMSPLVIQQDTITKKIPADSQSPLEPQIRVSDGGNRMWLLPVSDCTTWLEFIAHFTSLSDNFLKDYEVVFQGAVQDPDNWGSVIERAVKRTLYLSLRSKLIEFRRRRSSSSSSSSTSDEELSDSNPSPSRPVADKLASTEATDGSDSTTAGKDSQPNQKQESVDRKSKSAGTGLHGPSKARLHNPDSDGNQIASMNDSHIFLWAVVVPKKPEVPGKENEQVDDLPYSARGDQSKDDKVTFQYDMKRLKKIFADMDKRLRSKNFKKYRAYKKCPSRTLQEVDARSWQIIQECQKAQQKAGPGSKPEQNNRSPPSTIDEGDSRIRHVHIRKERSGSPVIDEAQRGNDEPHRSVRELRELKKFLRMAKTLFMCFLPLGFDSALVAKYWGAIYEVIEVGHKLSKVWNLFREGGWETHLLEPLEMIISNWTQGKAPQPWRVNVPDILGDAWLHLVMCLVLSLDSRPIYGYPYEEFEACKSVAVKGKKEILRRLAPGHLYEWEAVLTSGVTSLVVKNLVSNGVPGEPDIPSTYLEYLDQLERDFEINPYSRVHQEKLLHFRHEVSCIQNVLQDQSEIMQGLATFCRPTTSVRSLPPNYENDILGDCVSSTKERIANFEAMNSRAMNIGAYNIQRIEANKDRQEAAILVFTAVTIIFLPLSFVSSIFGMNTYDIRNMGTRQWLFWATAVPVTVLVIGLAIAAVLNFEPVRGLWAGIVERDRSRRVGRVESKREEDDIVYTE